MYNAYLTNCDGMLFPHGFKYSLSKKKDEHDFNEFLQVLTDYLHRHVVRVFRETQVTVEEYSFLKTIILFSGVMPLTDIGNEVVLRARRKYATLLSEYIASTRPDLSSDEQMERLAMLFSTIPHMMVLPSKAFLEAGLLGMATVAVGMAEDQFYEQTSPKELPLPT
ncbi:hypothetical protein ANCDUO_00733 [Ancylostoma duodenale]|uniref:NR LBD domain-containing protein n=1 Tax=Ancylostoma duodenale TaxID=51022 RepID=A0A0C2DG36_9BILA|nr:hypothetical protein ANCDUO_00733 [Ancylostoma duodenale]